jgi:HTH-type transcriptional regulator/antitoxin HigA
MTIKPIRNDDDLRRAFRRLEKVFQAAEGTPQADERDVLVTLIEAYENKHYDFGPADPVEAIKFRMEQEGLTPRDLEPYIGQSGRVSEVLNRRRPLSLRMVKRLHDGLKIPYESLMAGGSIERRQMQSRNAGGANLH